jgi:hypothetical protein
MDFTVVQWSVTNSGLQRNNFVSKIMESKSIIYEKVCNVYVPISAECKTTNVGYMKSAFTTQFDGDKQWRQASKILNKDRS